MNPDEAPAQDFMLTKQNFWDVRYLTNHRKVVQEKIIGPGALC